jgi:hypothetical protein
MPPMKMQLHECVRSTQQGENPKFICRVRSGWVVPFELERDHELMMAIGDYLLEKQLVLE